MIPTLKNFEQIEDFQMKFSPFCNGGRLVIYRGHANCDWEIRSTLERAIERSSKLTKDKIWEKYISTFKQFKDVAINGKYDGLRLEQQDQDFFYMSMARHLEMPSHFIDWTASMKLALEMACSPNNQSQNKDGVVWALSFPKEKIVQSIGNINIWEDTVLICKDCDMAISDKPIRYGPLGRMRRFRQNGFFTILNRKDFDKPFIQLVKDNDCCLNKILIPQGNKESLYKALTSLRGENYYGLDDNIFYNETDKALLDIINEFNLSIK